MHIFRDPDSGSDYKLPDVTGECYFSAPTDGSYYLVISSDSVSYTKTVKVSVTAAQTTTINDLIAGASPISKLPYTERMQLDSGAASVTSERCGYFRAYSIDLEAGTAVNLQLAATSGERDVELNVFTGNLKDGYSLIKSYDNDNYSGKGEQEMLFSEDGGTYYILCSTVDYASAGEVSFTVTASELRTLKEEMERVVPVSLPIFEEVVFDGVSNAIYNESDRTICFGKLYAVSMETDETIRISFGSPGMKSSTFVYVFRADSNGDPQFIQKFDRNEYGASSLGETVLFSADTEGIYYILAAGENGCVDDRVNSLIIDYVELMPSLILSGDNAGAQDSDDLWSWDGSTLTLKDGFELYTQDRSILFNSDIKIVVEGDALIYSNDSFALYGFSGEGRVDLELKSGAKLICHSDLEGCIYCGDIDIYASEGAAETPEVYLDSMSEHITDQFAVIDCMGISVEDVSMRIVSNDSAVMAYGGDISFINSDITIDSDGSGIVEFGLLDVIGSRLSIVSNLDSICGFIYGPYSYDDYTKIGTLDAELPGQLDPLPGLGAVGKAFEDINSVRFYDSEVTLISTWDDCIDIPGELTIIDSSVIGRSWYDTIYAETGINISGSGLKLSCGDSESSVIGGQADTEVDIDGKFRCYNRFGVLNYTGELTDSMRKPSAGYYELFTEYGGESTLVRKIDTVYDYLAGKNAEWSPGASDAGVFRVDAPLSRFVDVCLDGMPLGKGDYELRSGSTIVTLNPPVYSALSFGRHTLRINYSDGWAETEFTVLGGNPGTGDGIVIAALCAVLAVTVLGSVVIIRRKSVR